jgi:hypothetical protein
MLDAQWNRLIHYLRKGLSAAGHEVALLEVDRASGAVRISIPGTAQAWQCTVLEADLMHGDLILEAEYLLRTYRIACEKAIARVHLVGTAGRG